MAKKEVATYSQQTFEKIKHIDENGAEFWYARELQAALEYAQWRRFQESIERAKTACEASGLIVGDHFADVGKMINLAKGAQREIADIKLSRYACYLIVMNGDPRKEVIALGQTYFAVKTRQKEISDTVAQLSEDEKRLAIRDEVTIRNKFLASSARATGVETPVDYAVFQNRGYQGLYNGLGMKDIHKRKGLTSRYWITWALRSLRQTCSVSRRRMTNSVVKTSGVRNWRTKPILP